MVLLLYLNQLSFLRLIHYGLTFLRRLLYEFLLFLLLFFLQMFLFQFFRAHIMVYHIVIFDMLLVCLDKNSFFYHSYYFLKFHILLQVLLLLHILQLFHLVLVMLLASPYILDRLEYLELLQMLFHKNKIFLFLLKVLRVLLIT